MGTNHAGRHRPAERASGSGGAAPAAHSGPSGRLRARVVRRPLLSAGAALILVGASAAGYAKAGDAASSSAAAFTAPVAAVSQTHERSERLGRTAYQVEATALTHLRRSATTDATRAQLAAEADRVQAEQAAEVARLKGERELALAQASRDAQRQAVVDRAQQDPRAAARTMLGDFGWGDSQWSCLERLWVGESGWDYQATNRSSGAYGIAQALPAAKMGSVADDYRSNPLTQITWGLQYIQASYGTPCGALRSWNARSPHWY